MFAGLIITREEIEEGVEKLAHAVRRALERHPRGVPRFTITSIT